MKKRLIAFLLCISMVVGIFVGTPAEVFAAGDKIYLNDTNFPDANFRAALLQLLPTMVYSDQQGQYINKSDAEAIKELDVSAKGISSLQGIEFFTGLTKLSCHHNLLQNLSLRKNTALISLICTDNQLTYLNVSNATQLENLLCDNNRLLTLDVSNNVALQKLSCSNNQLGALNLDNNTALTSVIVRGQTPSARLAKIGEKYYLDVGALVGRSNLGKIIRNSTILPSQYDVTTGIATFDALPETFLYDYDIGYQSNAMIVTVTISGYVETERVYIDERFFPDANFLDYLLNELLPPVIKYTANGLPYVFGSDLKSFTEINISNRDIRDLGGIEYFTNLELLYCDNNRLLSLDLRTCPALRELSCKNNLLYLLNVSNSPHLLALGCTGNRLTTLDVSKNTALMYLYCPSNQLTALDVSRNPSLKFLHCEENRLKTLDVSKNTALEYLYCYSNQLGALELDSNSRLSHAQYNGQQLSAECEIAGGKYVLNLSKLVGTDNLGKVVINPENNYNYDASTGTLTFDEWPDTVTYDYAVGFQGTNMDVTVTTTESEKIYFNESNFPDANFRTALIDSLPSLVIRQDNQGKYITKSDAEAIEKLSIVDLGIGNLKGIEFFTGLTTLDCSDNNLTALDLSKNTALLSLDCSYNQLTDLDVSTNDSLQSLRCVSCGLTALNVRNNSALKSLACSENQLAELNVRRNTKLLQLDCWGNLLTALDVRKNVNLVYLSCSGNKLEEIDLSRNLNLEELYCNGNELTELDLSANAKMLILDCSSNHLAALDLSNNPLLDDVTAWSQTISAFCSQIGGLYVLDMNNVVGSENLSKVTFSGTVKYDNNKGIALFSRLPSTVSYTYSLGSQVDGMSVTATLSDAIYINEENFPDATFRDWLINTKLKYVVHQASSGTYVYKSDMDAVTSIDVTYKDITDLKGIEFFTGLTSLSCAGLQLTSLDVSKNTKLKKLYCYQSHLTELDVSKNTALEYLVCYGNELTELDVSKNTALIELNCGTNHLTVLDVSNHTALTGVYCFNQTTEAGYTQKDGVYGLDMKSVVGSENLSKVSFDDASVTYNADTGIVTLDSVPDTLSYKYAVGYEDVLMDVTLTLYDVVGKEKIYINEENFPDEIFRNYLIGSRLRSVLQEDENGLFAYRADLEEITSIDVWAKGVSDLTGIGFFTGLTTLQCGMNQLSTLDVSNNTALKNLYCYQNQLVTLDVSKNTSLECLVCYGNNLTELDASSNTAITDLRCAWQTSSAYYAKESSPNLCVNSFR